MPNEVHLLSLPARGSITFSWISLRLIHLSLAHIFSPVNNSWKKQSTWITQKASSRKYYSIVPNWRSIDLAWVAFNLIVKWLGAINISTWLNYSLIVDSQISKPKITFNSAKKNMLKITEAFFCPLFSRQIRRLLSFLIKKWKAETGFDEERQNRKSNKNILKQVSHLLSKLWWGIFVGHSQSDSEPGVKKQVREYGEG